MYVPHGKLSIMKLCSSMIISYIMVTPLNWWTKPSIHSSTVSSPHLHCLSPRLTSMYSTLNYLTWVNSALKSENHWKRFSKTPTLRLNLILYSPTISLSVIFSRKYPNLTLTFALMWFTFLNVLAVLLGMWGPPHAGLNTASLSIGGSPFVRARLWVNRVFRPFEIIHISTTIHSPPQIFKYCLNTPTALTSSSRNLCT